MADDDKTQDEESKAPARLRAKKTCPECGSTLIPHEGDANPFKVGAAHCNACGGCFIDGQRRR